MSINQFLPGAGKIHEQTSGCRQKSTQTHCPEIHTAQPVIFLDNKQPLHYYERRHKTTFKEKIMADDDTIISDSQLGQRLEKISKNENMYLVFEGKNIPLITKITIGRSKKNDIAIDDVMASRFHAEIHKIKNGYFIKDLDSTNGTLVNNDKIPQDKYIKLSVNDIIKIGRTELSIKSFIHG